MTNNPKFRIKKSQIAWLCSGPVTIAIAWILSTQPGWCETWYSRGFYPIILPVWSFLPSLLPVPLWEILAAWLVVGGLWLAGRGIFRLFRGPAAHSQRFLVRLAGFGLKIACLSSILLTVFLVFWGFNYQRQSWASNHGWTAPGGTPAQIEALARRLATEISRDRVLLPEGPSGLSQAKFGSWTDQALLARVNLAWDAAAARDPLLIPHSVGAKPALLPGLFSQFFVAGIFIPFTAEAVVNTGPGDFSVPFAAAHEIAHQRGWAREDEANFLAFLVLANSPDTDLRYAASANAYLYVEAIARNLLDPVVHKQIQTLLPPGYWSDVQANGRYWQGYSGIWSELGTTINDRYLKTQGQSEGVRSYGRMVDLLLAWNLLQK